MWRQVTLTRDYEFSHSLGRFQTSKSMAVNSEWVAWKDKLPAESSPLVNNYLIIN
jgi:hypothetical protein